MERKVKRRITDKVLDSHGESIVPLAIGLAVFWFVALCIATWYLR